MRSIRYRSLERYKYQLRADYIVDTPLTPGTRAAVDGDWVVLEPSGRLTVKDRYAWDGASGPARDTKTILRGSLVHDALYQLMREEKLNRREWREEADDLLKTHCLEDGMMRFRAWYVHRAVRRAGEESAMPRDPPPELVAP